MLATLKKLEADEATLKRIETWLNGPYDAKTKATITSLAETDPQALVDAFYTDLTFGTGGLRGVMGVGTNRINPYTIQAATQGLANYLIEMGEEDLSVAIGYDSRHNSDQLALDAARVLTGNGIRAHLFPALRPTPLVSWACRHLNCHAAIMVTASHNPPEYNGYKVYWKDGAQILPPHDQGIIAQVRAITSQEQVKVSEASTPLIQLISPSVEQAYLKQINLLQHTPQENQTYGSELHITFSNLHGTGGTLIPQALASWGFSNCSEVQEQALPDGSFPTVASPNPEEKAALQMGMDQMLQQGGDLLMATDPDADRLGIAVHHKGQAHLLNGNQIACLCLYHLCEERTRNQTFPEQGAFVKTIVTTELFKAIAESYGKPCEEVLTGFKYVAEKIRLWEEEEGGKEYLFGGEESYGYLLGTEVRDKDAVCMCCLVAEVALQAKRRGQTLIDLLHEIYGKFGVYQEKLFSLKFPETKEGREQMEGALQGLRAHPPQEIAGEAVRVQEDYLYSSRKELPSSLSPLDFPPSNVLLFRLEKGGKVAIRPSGTEPKVKIYVGASLSSQGSMEEQIDRCHQRAEELLQATRALLTSSSPT